MIELFEVDELKLYFGEDFKLNEYMTIHQPTLGEIVDMGEDKYFSLVHILTAIPSDVIWQLWESGIDWNLMEDFELFSQLIHSLTVEQSSILFGDFDFTEFEIIPVEGEHRHYLHHKKLNFDFDELMYKALTNYLCKMHGITKKIQKAGNEATKQMLVEMAKEDYMKALKKPKKSQMRALVSTMVNSPGFKYSLKEVRNIGYCEFMDSIARVSAINSAQALLNGCYFGNIDMKKLDKSELNYFRNIG